MRGPPLISSAKGTQKKKQREGDQQLDHREATQFQYSR